MKQREKQKRKKKQIMKAEGREWAEEKYFITWKRNKWTKYGCEVIPKYIYQFKLKKEKGYKWTKIKKRVGSSITDLKIKNISANKWTKVGN